MSDTPASAAVPLTAWQPTVSGNATLELSEASAGAAKALRFDFDFKGGKGFHRIVLGGGDFGEQRGADGDFDAVLEVDPDQVDLSGFDGRAETSRVPERKDDIGDRRPVGHRRLSG